MLTLMPMLTIELMDMLAMDMDMDTMPMDMDMLIIHTDTRSLLTDHPGVRNYTDKRNHS